MDRLITKKELKAIRKVLSMNRFEFADLLGFSESHVAKSEGRHKDSYEISANFDRTVKETLAKMNLDIIYILKVAKKEGYLK